MSLKEFQQYCLRHRVTFVSYSLPGELSPVSLFSPDSIVKSYNDVPGIDCNSGFLLTPFQSENLPVIVIPDQIKKAGWDIDLNELPQPSSLSLEKEIFYSQYEAISFERYESQIGFIKQRLLSGEAKKVVLSRTKIYDGLDLMQLPDVFEALVKKYTSAFVYLLYTPQSGIWLGATPESLLQADHLKFSTMALAGTREFINDSDIIGWTGKELKEHNYVVDYVRQKLNSGGYQFRESARESIRAGNVVHLRTMFEGQMQPANTFWKNLVLLLYPTPAICGTENEATLQLIRQTEEHNREYYAGIIGPFNGSGKTDLFINLRCMKIIDNTALLFAGSGILEESSALPEWEEIEMKFKTLIDVMSQVKEKLKVGG